jgi:rubredoxin
MKCSLCGYAFEEDVSTACPGCIFSKSCKMVCCPNCGYKMPLEAKIIKFFRNRRKKLKNGSK